MLQRQDGTFYQVSDPADEDVAASAAAFLGGHEYTVSDAMAAALTAAGYGAWLTEVI